MITGEQKPDSGVIRLGDTVKLAYVEQSREILDPNKTIWESISGGSDLVQLGNRSMNSRAYVAQFNFSGTDQQKKLGVLSGGERNRVHLAMMLLAGANLLLLDEPTNDLDVNTMRALEEGWGISRKRHGGEPRQVVPRQNSDTHPRLRGGEQRPLV
jgi:ATPase subunit of ABC transporter with duplicated ATPase domains